MRVKSNIQSRIHIIIWGGFICVQPISIRGRAGRQWCSFRRIKNITLTKMAILHKADQLAQAAQQQPAPIPKRAIQRHCSPHGLVLHDAKKTCSSEHNRCLSPGKNIKWAQVRDCSSIPLLLLVLPSTIIDLLPFQIRQT